MLMRDERVKSLENSVKWLSDESVRFAGHISTLSEENNTLKS
jgi:hypothetical protein